MRSEYCGAPVIQKDPKEQSMKKMLHYYLQIYRESNFDRECERNTNNGELQ